MSKTNMYNLGAMVSNFKSNHEAGYKLPDFYLTYTSISQSKDKKTRMFDGKEIAKTQTVIPLILQEKNIELLFKNQPQLRGEPILTVGKLAENDINISDVKISRIHAYFTRPNSAGPIYLTDISSNGTFLDGERLTKGLPYVLFERATIRFGPSVIARGNVWEFYSLDRFIDHLKILRIF